MATVVAIALGAWLPSGASAQPCVVVDNGTGTITLPPEGCEYLSPTEVHEIIDGLPIGTTIQLAPIHKDFICSKRADVFPGCPPPGVCEDPATGTDCFDSVLEMSLTGTGDLAGLSRVIPIPMVCQVQAGLRNPGDPVQDFVTDMRFCQGGIFGDPDFDSLQITAGTGFGLPSPGQTKLTDLGNGTWQVDSFFDITYTIDYVGSPGGALNGATGSTTATLRMEANGPAPAPCPLSPTGAGFCQAFANNCIGTGNELCSPSSFRGTNQGPVVDNCACALDTDCGPLNVTTDAVGQITRFDCPGVCPTANNLCEIALDGNRIGTPSIQAIDVQAGQIVTCECPKPLPDPHLTVQGTSVTFGSPDTPPIPADFFGPGSDPLVGAVNLVGGPTQTLGQRSGAIVCPGAGFPRPCDPVSVELVQLDLVSSAPIMVTLNGGQNPAPWDVAVELSLTAPQALGTMDATKTHANGGTYDADIPFSPRFTFTEVANPANVRVFDYDLDGELPIRINFLAANWVVQLGPLLVGTVDAPNNGNFVPGVRENVQGDANTQKVVQSLGLSKGGGVDHPVQPVTFCRLPDDGTGVPAACAQLQTRDCIGSANDSCLPTLVQVNNTGGANAVACDCTPVTPAPICGPVEIGVDATGVPTVSCPGGCPPPEAAPCQLYEENPDGTSTATGLTSARASSFPPGTILRCDCAPPVERCCQPGGLCGNFTPDVCRMLNGAPGGAGSACAGTDLNVNGRDDACELDDKCSLCPPGPHWVDTCPAGLDHIPTGAVVGIDLTGDCIQDVTVVLGGPSTVSRVAGAPHQIIPTEMIAMTLTGEGMTLVAGGGGGVGGVLAPTFGKIIEQAGDVTSADSSFDVFFELSGGPLAVPAYNQIPLPVLTKILCLPPNGTYVHPVGMCIPLFDSPIPGTGVFVANLVAASHTTYPGCTSDADCPNKCDVCDPTTLTCVTQPPDVCCVVAADCPSDGNPCTDEVCDALTNLCLSRPIPGCVCQPDDAATSCVGECADATLQCRPKRVNYNPTTGETRIITCGCDTIDGTCSVDVAPATVPRGPAGNPCDVVDNGTGTVTLPPAGCEYLSPDEVHEIIDGLPANTTIEFAPIHKDFICNKQGAVPPLPGCPPPGICEEPGGALGGKTDCFQSGLQMTVSGTGGLAGFNRLITVPMQCKVETGPRVPGDLVQEFDTRMANCQGEIFGDPDFCSLRILAGTENGLPSPGRTVLTDNGNGTFAVDSFFDITYRIDFVGCPGSAIDGMSGTTVRTIHMATGNEPNCVGVCGIDEHCVKTRVVNPDGTVDVICDCVVRTGACCVGGACNLLTAADCAAQGGFYGGNGTNCDDTDGNNIADICDCLPTSDGAGCVGPCQTGNCLPRCVSVNPVTGKTTVVDCDCTATGDCQVELPTPPGTPGGVSAAGLVGNPCIVPDDAGGTVTLPPIGCDYLSPQEVHAIMDAAGSGVTFELAPIHKDFICSERGDLFPGCTPPNICEMPGGNLGGNVDCFESTLELSVSSPELTGFARTLFVPASVRIDTGPRTPGDAVQGFDTEMVQLQGELFGDPDFCTLKITAGSGSGLPSPGRTTLTRLGPPGSSFAVDSFFDITYRIDFAGCPGSAIEGMGGSTTATLRMQTGTTPACIGGCGVGETCVETITVDAAGNITKCCDCQLDAVCEPTADRTACKPFDCPDPNATCRPTKLEVVGTCLAAPISCVQDSDCPANVCVLTEEVAECDCVPDIPPPSCRWELNNVTGAHDCVGVCVDGVTACNVTTQVGTGGTVQYVCGCSEPTECVPNATGTACEPFVCPGPLPPLDTCVASCVDVDPLTGVVRITACDCRGLTECRAQVGTVAGGANAGAMALGTGGNPCVVPDNGSGTVTLPPPGCEYLSPDEVHEIIDGLPTGVTIEFATIHKNFICERQPGADPGFCPPDMPPGLCEDEGGDLGGNVECGTSDAELTVTITDTVGGGTTVHPMTITGIRHLFHSGPHGGGKALQGFDTEMVSMQGEAPPDAVFSQFRIVAGRTFGLPSPGRTTLRLLPSGDYNVDSFFDVFYQIDYVGDPAGPLAGAVGSSMGTVRMSTGSVPQCEGACPDDPFDQCIQTSTVVENPDGTVTITACCDCGCPPSSAPTPVPILDAAGNSKDLTANRFLIFEAGDPGRSQAIRVTLNALAPAHSLWNGQQLFVGQPGLVSNAGATVPPAGTPTDFMAAQLQCEPLCRDDWSTLGELHVFHEGVIPASAYSIEVVDCKCDLTDKNNYSPALLLGTSALGDTLEDMSIVPPGPPDGGRNVIDVLGVLASFASTAAAPRKARSDIEPNCLDLLINVTDALQTLAGFAGGSYSFPPKTDDLCLSPCTNPVPVP